MKKINKYLIGVLFMFSSFFIGVNITHGEDSITIYVNTTPTVTTTAISDITSSTAIGAGNVTSDGGAQSPLTVTERGLVWSIEGDGSPTITSNVGKTSNGTGTGAFTSNIMGLIPGTVYNLRAYATNSIGTGYGAEINFETIAGSCSIPTQTVTVACDARAGYVIDSGLVDRTQYAYYPECTFPAPPITVDNSVYASDSCIYSLIVSPQIQLQAVTNITTTSATLNAEVINTGNPTSTFYGFYYGPDHSLSNTITKSFSGNSLTYNMVGLNPGSTYYFKAYITNQSGTIITTEGSFTTLVGSPILTTNPITNVRYQGSTLMATSGGNITSDGGGSVWSRGLVAGSSIDNIIYNSVTCGSGTGSYSCDIDLPGGINSTFYIRSWAQNASGKVYGNIISGNTNLPTVTTSTPVTNIAKTTATGGGTTVSKGGADILSASGLIWSKTQYPTISSYEGITYNGWAIGGPWSSDMTGLTPNTTYYVRAYALSPLGVSYGSQVSFKTKAPMSGGLTSGSSSSCIITTTGSTCSMPLYWNIKNAESTETAITTSGMIDIDIFTELIDSQSGTESVTVPYSTTDRRFYLYNNAKELAYTDLSSMCDIPNSYEWSDTYGHCIKFRSLNVSKIGTGVGTVSSTEINCGTTCSHSYEDGSEVILTATPDTSSRFVGWTGCTSVNLGGQCLVSMDANKTITANFEPVTISLTASPTTHNVPASNPSVSFTYTPNINTGTVECQLRNYNNSAGLTPWATNTKGIVNTIIYSAPSIAGSYGYYIQCRSALITSIVSTSQLITVNSIQVSVPVATPYNNVVPGSTVAFTHTASTIPSNIPALDPKVECLLQDNEYNNLTTTYQTSSPISYAVTNNIGSYGYYIKCRNTLINTATTTSGLITVNTSCGTGVWNDDQNKCIDTKGTLGSQDCVLQQGETSCMAVLDWTLNDPVNTPTAITANGIVDIDVTNTMVTPQSGNELVSVTSSPKTFYLYNNGKLLAQTEAMAVPPPTGELTASACFIQENQSYCNTKLNWNTYNPLRNINSIVEVSPLYKTTPEPPASNLGTDYLYPIIPNGGIRFRLYHDDAELTNPSTPIIPIASCANSNLEWNGSMCVLRDPIIDSFKATPVSIFKNKSSTLSWQTNTELVSSCNITSSTPTEIVNMPTDTRNGSTPVSPLVNTTYTLTCIGVKPNTSTTSTAVTKIVDIVIKEN